MKRASGDHADQPPKLAVKAKVRQEKSESHSPSPAQSPKETALSMSCSQLVAVFAATSIDGEEVLSCAKAIDLICKDKRKRRKFQDEFGELDGFTSLVCKGVRRSAHQNMEQLLHYL